MIGVFDSGYGGLTILQALRQRMPQFDYLYLGDNARAPYGVRSQEEIYQFTRGGVDWLFKQGARIVVLGCNTASANALKRLQTEYLPAHFPDRRILGILAPTVEAITGTAWRDAPVLGGAESHIVIFGTPATVGSLAYTREIMKRNPSVRVTEQACPTLVPMIERGAHPDDLQAAVKNYVAQARSRASKWPPDAMVLGCTHYALLAKYFTDESAGALVYDQGTLTADALERYLSRHQDIAGTLGKGGSWNAFTTGDAGTVSQLATRFFHVPFTFAHARYPTDL